MRQSVGKQQYPLLKCGKLDSSALMGHAVSMSDDFSLGLLCHIIYL